MNVTKSEFESSFVGEWKSLEFEQWDCTLYYSCPDHGRPLQEILHFTYLSFITLNHTSLSFLLKALTVPGV